MLRRTLVLVGAIPALASACSTVAYHHSERVSLALEAKQTDPAQPLHGNLGLKTRTVLVAPEGTNGDAANVVSDFKLRRTPEGLFGRTQINSAFLTGAAAAAAPSTTVAVMGGLASAAVGTEASVRQKLLVRNVYQTLNALGEPAAAHVDGLDRLAGLVPGSPAGPFYTLGPTGKTLQPTVFTPPPTADFRKSLAYLDALDTSIAAIQAVEKDRGIADAAGAPFSASQMDALKKEKAALQKERAAFAASLTDSPAFESAARYVLDSV